MLFLQLKVAIELLPQIISISNVSVSVSQFFVHFSGLDDKQGDLKIGNSLNIPSPIYMKDK